MILIASCSNTRCQVWYEILCNEYDVHIHDDPCLKALNTTITSRAYELLILDIDIFENKSLQGIPIVHGISPKLNIIAMTASFEPQEQVNAILAGAKALFEYDISADILKKAVKAVLNQEVWVDRKFISRLVASLEDITKVQHEKALETSTLLQQLTPRELEISKLLASGNNNRDIASKLNISERTVKAHLGVIFRKLNCSDRVQLALFMNRHDHILQILKIKDNL